MAPRRSLSAVLLASAFTFLSISVNAQSEDSLFPLSSDLYSRSASLEDDLFDHDLDVRDLDSLHLYIRDILDEDEELFKTLLARTDGETKPAKKLSYNPASVLSPLAPLKAGGAIMPHYLKATTICKECGLVCTWAGKGAIKVPGLGHGDYHQCPKCHKFC